MAVTEVAAPASGSRRLRRGVGLALLTVALAACGGGQALQGRATDPSASVVRKLLTPLQTITGGRQAAAMDVTGTPKPGALRGFVNFITPSALAVRGPDLYVADMGARKLYRLDAMQQVLSVVPGVNAAPRMRLQVATDLSLYVLDPDHAAIQHFTRGGRLLQTFTDPALAMNLTNFVLDEGAGRIIASDQLNQRLLRLPLAGHIVSTLPHAEVGAYKALGALARSGEDLYVLDSACVCIVRVDAEGRVLERFGYGALTQPQAMVADRYGRVFISDIFDRSLKVFLRGELVARFEPHQLNIVNISAMALDENVLYIADGPGSRVVAFRVQLPGAGDAQAR